ncbi:MAG: flagellar basal body rod C-terminal domain-containing protein [Humidesulfovibrio sp.]|uniref:flagellar basal body rod C-terminal domain-containing protein n=1 Tax=Humidesulfovibrio sp. TaxID=2910988 RepID=UPI0027FD1104|nr:flagellar basal body rod C-terminal domain-containing protein [Humidesulfovibrio sp.]MDQ7835134.1 flagellar basal body rod C-terminal domain-containing protein [Humidesulfovibrio sp.]
MTLDVNWNLQAISALDVSAMAASENIANANSDNYRPVRVELEDGVGGKGVRVADIVELTSTTSGLDNTPLVPDGRPTDYASGLIRPTSYTGEGSGVDIAREMVDLIQVERAFSANVAAIGNIDSMTGNILNMMA